MLVDWVLNDNLMINQTILVFVALYYNKFEPGSLVKPNDSCNASSPEHPENIS